MGAQFIVNDKGEKTAVIDCEFTDNYREMMDSMLKDEEEKHISYISLKCIKDRFLSK